MEVQLKWWIGLTTKLNKGQSQTYSLCKVIQNLKPKGDLYLIPIWLKICLGRPTSQRYVCPAESGNFCGRPMCTDHLVLMPLSLATGSKIYYSN